MTQLGRRIKVLKYCDRERRGLLMTSKIFKRTMVIEGK